MPKKTAKVAQARLDISLLLQAHARDCQTLEGAALAEAEAETLERLDSVVRLEVLAFAALVVRMLKDRRERELVVHRLTLWADLRPKV